MARASRIVMHVGIANPRWWGKRSRPSRCIRNPQFCVSGKRPMNRTFLRRISLPRARCLMPQGTGFMRNLRFKQPTNQNTCEGYRSTDTWLLYQSMIYYLYWPIGTWVKVIFNAYIQLHCYHKLREGYRSECTEIQLRCVSHDLMNVKSTVG